MASVDIAGSCPESKTEVKKKSSIKFGCVLDNGQHWISPMDVGSKLTLWMMMMMIGDF